LSDRGEQFVVRKLPNEEAIKTTTEQSIPPAILQRPFELARRQRSNEKRVCLEIARGLWEQTLVNYAVD
jgi:hypothetical protein